MLGKIINGQIKYPNKTELIGNTYVANPTNKILIADGYKDVVYSEHPGQLEGYSVNTEYIETETEINVIYTLVETVNEEPII